MNRRLLVIFFIATLGLYAWPAYDRFLARDRDPGTFVVGPIPATGAPDSPFFQREFISPDVPDRIVHVGSICELPYGGLAAAWYGGTREGARDVSIFLSTRSAEAAAWSRPKVIMDRVLASRDLSRYIKKVGNPVLFSNPQGRLYLIYVSITVGGWSGSSLNLTWSDDHGQTWGRSRRLTLSPFFNISELVRNRPVSLSNHGFAVPIYHECLGYFPEILWLHPGAAGLKIRFAKTRMDGGASFIQPALAALDPSNAIAFYRPCGDNRAIGRAVTRDAGLTWSEPQLLSLPNPDAALDALPLSDRRLLLAYNDSPVTRENLCLAVSTDRGREWSRVNTLENEPEAEFSYPYMIRTRDGRIHVVYTWDRKRIAHVVFNEAWVTAQSEAKSP